MPKQKPILLEFRESDFLEFLSIRQNQIDRYNQVSKGHILNEDELKTFVENRFKFGIEKILGKGVLPEISGRVLPFSKTTFLTLQAPKELEDFVLDKTVFGICEGIVEEFVRKGYSDFSDGELSYNKKFERDMIKGYQSYAVTDKEIELYQSTKDFAECLDSMKITAKIKEEFLRFFFEKTEKGLLPKKDFILKYGKD